MERTTNNRRPPLRYNYHKTANGKYLTASHPPTRSVSLNSHVEDDPACPYVNSKAIKRRLIHGNLGGPVASLSAFAHTRHDTGNDTTGGAHSVATLRLAQHEGHAEVHNLGQIVVQEDVLETQVPDTNTKGKERETAGVCMCVTQTDTAGCRVV